MNREEYRKAFDALSFSADFEQRTVDRLARAAGQEKEKEILTMKTKRFGKTALLAAALAAMLVVSVSAVVALLSPKEVAEHMGDPVLAAAFESEGAVLLDETVTSGDYTVTLAGLISGDGLSANDIELNGEVISDRTYAVFTVENADGTPLQEQPWDLNYTPLVSGYYPWAVNSWTLGAGVTSFVEEGAAYYLLDTRNLEMFADHTVYLALYEGGVPSSAMFTMAEDGAIAFAPGWEGPQILFTLPLDPAKADPAAAAAFVEGTGLDFQAGPAGDDAPQLPEDETWGEIILEE